MQINVGHLDANGVYTNSFSTFALAGSVRAMVRRAAARCGLLVLARGGNGRAAACSVHTRQCWRSRYGPG